MTAVSRALIRTASRLLFILDGRSRNRRWPTQSHLWPTPDDVGMNAVYQEAHPPERQDYVNSRAMAIVALAAASVVCVASCGATGPSQVAGPSQAALTAAACRTVDGSAHVELSGNMGAQFNAEAADRTTTANALNAGVGSDPTYTDLIEPLQDLAAASRANAANYQTNPSQLAKDILDTYVPILEKARQVCQTHNLATK
jgi:hypothetical protein